MPRRTHGTYAGLEDLGRVRLSPHFFMRDRLHSGVWNFYGKSNLPVYPDRAIAAGKKLCAAILDVMTETFGPLHIRSSHRLPDLNHFGASEVKPQGCFCNEANYAGHIWGIRDAKGRLGATASIVVPWSADQFEKGRNWRDLAWWIHDHLNYHRLHFFPKLAAFNVIWCGASESSILSYLAPQGKLCAEGQIAPEAEKTHRARHANFLLFKGISYPKVPA